MPRVLFDVKYKTNVSTEDTRDGQRRSRDLTGQVFIDYRFEQTVMVQLLLLCILPQPSIEASLFVFRALYSFASLALCISVSSIIHFLLRSQLRWTSISR